MGRFQNRTELFMSALWPNPVSLNAEAVIHDDSDEDFAEMVAAMSEAKRAVNAANQAIRKYERAHKPVKSK